MHHCSNDAPYVTFSCQYDRDIISGLIVLAFHRWPCMVSHWPKPLLIFSSYPLLAVFTMQGEPSSFAFLVCRAFYPPISYPPHRSAYCCLHAVNKHILWLFGKRLNLWNAKRWHANRLSVGWQHCKRKGSKARYLPTSLVLSPQIRCKLLLWCVCLSDRFIEPHTIHRNNHIETLPPVMRAPQAYKGAD